MTNTGFDSFLCLKTYLWSVFSKISDGDGKERPPPATLATSTHLRVYGFILYCFLFLYSWSFIHELIMEGREPEMIYSVTEF